MLSCGSRGKARDGSRCVSSLETWRLVQLFQIVWEVHQDELMGECAAEETRIHEAYAFNSD